jgi:transposase InsO family protein
MQERMQFVVEALGGAFTMTELCERYGVSRKTGYKWVERFKQDGWLGLADLSRRPQRSPTKTAESVAERILVERRRRPRWGAKKILDRLRTVEPDLVLPSRSTAHVLLKRAELVRPRRRRAGRGVNALVGDSVVERPNECWTTDHKGQFRVGTGQLCYPLTIADAFSRYLLACDGLPNTSTEQARPVFERVFREHGLPARILSDNGPPFGSTALLGLSRLAVWWLKLGIEVVRIERGHPEQNGRHERMHRTLKEEAARPAAPTWRGQQRRLREFRREYNEERPHDSLQGRTPASCYMPSPSPYTKESPGLDYPVHYTRRQVRHSGEIKWGGRKIFLSEILAGEPVGLDEIDEGKWAVYFGPLELGRILDRTGRFYCGAPKRSRIRRRDVNPSPAPETSPLDCDTANRPTAGNDPNVAYAPTALRPST